MFDLLTPPTIAAIAAVAADPAKPVPAATPWLALMLDEIDYGMLLLAGDTTVLYASHVARTSSTPSTRCRC